MESKPLPDQQDKHDSWRLIEPQPLREEQVQNAVKFLAHPNVKGSSIIDRRSFLERKGLTKEEIDEAFRRVPDSPSEAGNAVASVQGSTGAEKQLRTPVTSKVSAPLLASQQHSGQVALPDNHVHSNKFHWIQMVLAIGVITTAGAGATVLAKSYILPKFKAWLRHLVLEDDESRIKPTEPGPMKEVASAAAAAAATAAAAASDIAVVTKDILLTRNEDRRYLENTMKAVEAQTQELKLTLSSMREAVLSIEKSMHQSVAPNVPVHNSELNGNANATYRSLGSTHQATEDGKLQNGAVPGSVSHNSDNNGLVRPSSAPPGGAPNNTPHSASYMEIVAMLQRGEKPPNIQDVNDKPPNPNQSPSNPKLQPRLKPWEIPGENSFSKFQISASIKPAVDNEKRTSTSNFGNDSEKSAIFVETLATSSSSDPWWHHKKSEKTYAHASSNWLTESNVRITELEPESEATVDGVDKAEARPSLSAPTFGSGVAERGQGWIPPSVPQAILPGAAAAIRHQKMLVNGSDIKPSSTSRLGAVLGQSSSSEFESDPTLPFSINETQSEEVRETPDGQESNVIGKSAVEKPSYKDVVVEGGVP